MIGSEKQVRGTNSIENIENKYTQFLKDLT